MCYVERIGIRELQQHASHWVRRVRQGESFEITDRGRLVAVLVPAAESRQLDRLVARGGARSPARDVELAPTIEGDGSIGPALLGGRVEDDR